MVRGPNRRGGVWKGNGLGVERKGAETRRMCLSGGEKRTGGKNGNRVDGKKEKAEPRKTCNKG